MKEIWKDIPGAKKKYQVSNMGRARIGINCYGNKKPYKILATKPDPHGYHCLDMYLEGKGRMKRVRLHRMILLSFRGSPKKDQTCSRHLDGVKVNNLLSNLVWGTKSENEKDFYRHGGKKGFAIPRIMHKALQTRGVL